MLSGQFYQLFIYQLNKEPCDLNTHIQPRTHQLLCPAAGSKAIINFSYAFSFCDVFILRHWTLSPAQRKNAQFMLSHCQVGGRAGCLNYCLLRHNRVLVKKDCLHWLPSSSCSTHIRAKCEGSTKLKIQVMVGSCKKTKHLNFYVQEYFSRGISVACTCPSHFI